MAQSTQAKTKIESTKAIVYHVGRWLSYKDIDGAEKNQVRCVIIDINKGPMHLWGYDKIQQQQYLIAGNSLKLKNCLLRNDGLVATKFSKVMQ